MKIWKGLGRAQYFWAINVPQTDRQPLAVYILRLYTLVINRVGCIYLSTLFTMYQLFPLLFPASAITSFSLASTLNLPCWGTSSSWESVPGVMKRAIIFELCTSWHCNFTTCQRQDQALSYFVTLSFSSILATQHYSKEHLKLQIFHFFKSLAYQSKHFFSFHLHMLFVTRTWMVT